MGVQLPLLAPTIKQKGLCPMKTGVIFILLSACILFQANQAQAQFWKKWFDKSQDENKPQADVKDRQISEDIKSKEAENSKTKEQRVYEVQPNELDKIQKSVEESIPANPEAVSAPAERTEQQIKTESAMPDIPVTEKTKDEEKEEQIKRTQEQVDQIKRIQDMNTSQRSMEQINRINELNRQQRNLDHINRLNKSKQGS